MLETSTNGAGAGAGVEPAVASREDQVGVAELGFGAGGRAVREGVPDPELVEQAKRRTFTAEFKARIVAEADACTRAGEVGELLRREGLYTSHLTYWRKQRKDGALKELGKPRGRKPSDKRDQEIAHVRKWIDYAAIMGAPHIRIFAGAPPAGVSPGQAKSLCISAIEECCDYAGGKGIFLGLENHGGIVATAEEILEIVRGVKSPWLGVNLDTGNFHTDDPYADLVKIAPYAVNVQMKGEVHPRGKSEEPADLPRLVKILRDANYQGYVALEYESKEDPWTAVPRLVKQMKELFGA